METGLLTNKQRQQLAAAISIRDMEMVAQGYLNIDSAVIESLRNEHFGKAEEVQAEACNTALLQRWANRAENAGPHQIKVSSAKRTWRRTVHRRISHMGTLIANGSQMTPYIGECIVQWVLGTRPIRFFKTAPPHRHGQTFLNLMQFFGKVGVPFSPCRKITNFCHNGNVNKFCYRDYEWPDVVKPHSE